MFYSFCSSCGSNAETFQDPQGDDEAGVLLQQGQHLENQSVLESQLIRWQDIQPRACISAQPAEAGLEVHFTRAQSNSSMHGGNGKEIAKKRFNAKAKHEDQPDQRQLRKEQRAGVERRAAVAAFLRQHGFLTIKTSKKEFLKGRTYALHAAARAADARMVNNLLLEGADKEQLDSDGKTPLQVAMKSNRKGSKGGTHDAVIRALSPSALEGGARR
eukprot:TRINITY_DN4474_c0_g1_i3.p1 TRINITY_DN4474_c0_g1~~TRINITY_DN4474_c0_g1_i3.p1  ORF type:complete len:216 (-),score=45.91 TRINITY_DN4474_c0_g1_i3:277-924(-)